MLLMTRDAVRRRGSAIYTSKRLYLCPFKDSKYGMKVLARLNTTMLSTQEVIRLPWPSKQQIKSRRDRPHLFPDAACSRSYFGVEHADSLKYHDNSVHSEDRVAISEDVKDDTGFVIASTRSWQSPKPTIPVKLSRLRI